MLFWHPNQCCSVSNHPPTALAGWHKPPELCPDQDVCPVCLSACPAGFYGRNCQQRCLCQNGGTCDPATGACACPAGWTGLACELGEQTAWETALGQTFLLWSGFPGEVGGDVRGVGVHGPSCECGGVGAGRVGTRTVPHPVPLPACAQGQHGLDCQQRCECQHGGLCDRQTGHCHCQPGWTGHKCERGKWGLIWVLVALSAPGAAQGGSGGLSKGIKCRFQQAGSWQCHGFGCALFLPIAAFSPSIKSWKGLDGEGP